MKKKSDNNKIEVDNDYHDVVQNDKVHDMTGRGDNCIADINYNYNNEVVDGKQINNNNNKIEVDDHYDDVVQNKRGQDSQQLLAAYCEELEKKYDSQCKYLRMMQQQFRTNGYCDSQNERNFFQEQIVPHSSIVGILRPFCFKHMRLLWQHCLVVVMT
jgi:hypothetical protein